MAIRISSTIPEASRGCCPPGLAARARAGGSAAAERRAAQIRKIVPGDGQRLQADAVAGGYDFIYCVPLRQRSKQPCRFLTLGGEQPLPAEGSSGAGQWARAIRQSLTSLAGRRKAEKSSSGTSRPNPAQRASAVGGSMDSQERSCEPVRLQDVSRPQRIIAAAHCGDGERIVS